MAIKKKPKKKSQPNILDELRIANLKRAKEWNVKGVKVPISFAFMEFAGEAGEVCNAGKKLARYEMGMAGGTKDKTNLIEELADSIICIDLIAKHFKINLTETIRSKFNQTSDKHGFKTHL